MGEHIETLNMKFFTFTSFVVVAACAMADDIAPETFDSPLIASFFAEHEAPETILSENKEVFKDSMVAALFETPETTLLEKKEDSKAPKKVSQTIKKLAKNPIFDTHKHQLGVIQTKLEAIETSHKGYNGNGGGAEDLASRVSTATTDISNAVKTMQEGLESDHALGKTEIKALYDAIDKTADITPAEKEAVKQKAKTWCEKKQDYDNKKGTYDNAVSDRNGKDGSADTGLNTLKEIFGDTSVTSCSKASYPNTQCPDLAQCTDLDKFTVVATLVTKLNDARKAYRLAQIAEADAKGPMDDAEAANTQAKDAFKQMITDYVQSKFDECGGSKSTLYTTAKSAFSEQNTQRAKMYHALGQVQCYIQHIDNHDSTSKALTAQSVPKTSGASATSAADCVSAMKTAAEIKAAKFTEYTNSGSVSGCKTKAELEKQISDYGNLQLTKDVWAPITSTCDAVNAHTTAQGCKTGSATGTDCCSCCTTGTCACCQGNNDCKIGGNGFMGQSSCCRGKGSPEGHWNGAYGIPACYAEYKSSNYYMLPVNTNGCPKGQEVKSFDECKVALKAVGLEVPSSNEYQATYFPTGCTWKVHQNHLLYSSEITQGEPYAMPVCRKTAALLPVD